MRAQAGLTAADSQPQPILPQKPASDYQIHYIIRVLLLQKHTKNTSRNHKTTPIL